MNIFNSISQLLIVPASLTLLTESGVCQVAVSGTTSAGGGTVVAVQPLTVTHAAPFGEGTSRSVTIITNKDGDDGHAIEVRIENDKMTVKCDGEEVPESRIRKEDGRIVILDEKGNAIDSVGVVMGKDGQSMFGGVGGTWAFSNPGGQWTTWAPMLGATAEGEKPKVMLGVHMAEPGPALAKHLRLNSDECTMINGTLKGLPADKAGIEQYDIIVKIDGQSPANSQAIHDALKDKSGDDTVTFTIIHEGKTKEVKVRLAEYDAGALQNAERLGEAVDSMYFRGLFPKDLNLSGDAMKLYQGALRLKDVMVAPDKRELFVVPDHQQLQDEIKQHMRGFTTERKDLDKRLDELNNRMESLERLLEKLIEKSDKGR